MMKEYYTIGIDIGGTHIDLVAVNKLGEILSTYKVVTGLDLTYAIIDAIQVLLGDCLLIEQCIGVHLGTTLSLNALLELTSLYRVGVIRIAGYKPDLPPAYQFSQQQRESMLAGFETISGGFEHNKQKILGEFSVSDLYKAFERLLEKNAESIAIVGTFAPLYADEELEVLDRLMSLSQNLVPITLSHQVGGIGFFGRENNAILNAALKKVASQHFVDLHQALQQKGFLCELYITQNNGTLLTIDEAIAFPIKTIASGPTNSLNGACKLAGLNKAIVVDIGGTSTEIGVVENGFPRYSTLGANLAGIPTNFMLPDLHVLALGGGSMIERTKPGYVIGPCSVGAALCERAQSYHGDVLTLFDVGNVLRHVIPEHGCMITSITLDIAQTIMALFLETIQRGIGSIMIEGDVSMVYVGGGSENIPEHFFHAKKLRPKHYQVANAYGAALAEISCSIDETRDLSEEPEKTIRGLEAQALEQVIARGACKNHVRIIEKRLLPYYYMNTQLTRIMITAAGKSC